MNKTEEANTFYSIVQWLVEDKEGRNREHQWSQGEIEHIKLGLSLMQEKQRNAFRERFKDYRIIRALYGSMK